MKTKAPDISTVIAQRVKLQSTQIALANDFLILNAESALSEKNLGRYLTWPEDKKNKFTVVIGGRANFKKTQKYIESLLEKITE